MDKCLKNYRFSLADTLGATPLGPNAAPGLTDADVVGTARLSVQVESGAVRLTEDSSTPSTTNGILLTGPVSYSTIVPYHKIKMVAVGATVVNEAFYQGK